MADGNADPVIDQLEPGARFGNGWVMNPDERALISLAISMKRIADRLEENTSDFYNQPAFRTRSD